MTEDEVEQIVQRRLNEELSKFNIAGASGYGTQWALPQSYDSSRADGFGDGVWLMQQKCVAGVPKQANFLAEADWEDIA